MKISLNQLKTYVDINIPVLEMCDKMVMAGFEVESIEKQGDNLEVDIFQIFCADRHKK